ncbi:MAG: hypothetical protein NTZ26_03050 [Candidatus Aminicenantes bacterium]|nr:hypothetical protein [Candidatus Aminicenantes bacterium]
MDAYLTPDARLALQALAVTSGRAASAGFLIGHVRGGRFIVEGLVPAASPTTISDPEIFFRLDALYAGRIIGFFLAASAASARKPLLRPHACGKLVLAARKTPSGRSAWKGFLIEFDGEFSFARAQIISETERKP